MLAITMMELFIIFFQAEDGIRDIGVTGVQTCALPILLARLPVEAQPTVVKPSSRALLSATETTRSLNDSVGKLTASFLRSEERRVGKECRSRWSQNH